uniref:Mutator-like transposase domain-containing protein n=1 Tax=Magallana gigas TaxID=29159 RepID=A0A8W8JLI7_MAGGI
MLKIPCSNTVCKPTGKRHDDRVWDVNRKLAAAVQHTGVGYTQINGILAELNIPPISKTLLYTRQEEVGQATESVASSSINDALQEEVEATTKNKQSTSITVSVDGAWQKRGSGRSYDSLTGHCSMIGSQTGKIVGYSVRNKFCRQCDNATERNQLPPPHNCKRNWTGSSKSMEPDMGIQMELSLHPFGNHIECSEVWCHHKRNPTTSKYSSLPYGKPLKGEVLQQDLENTFHKLKKHSTASVAQKNMGESYLIQVNKRLGLSPGTYTRRLAAQKDLAARRKRALAVTSKAKKRRLHLRAKRNQTAASRETREPVNYCPQVALNDNEESLGTAVEIPPPITRPAPEPAEFSKENNPFIYFDLESTGLARNSHITQIAAVCGNEKFSQWILLLLTSFLPETPATQDSEGVTWPDEDHISPVALLPSTGLISRGLTSWHSLSCVVQEGTSLWPGCQHRTYLQRTNFLAFFSVLSRGQLLSGFNDSCSEGLGRSSEPDMSESLVSECVSKPDEDHSYSSRTYLAVLHGLNVIPAVVDHLPYVRFMEFKMSLRKEQYSTL